MSGDVSENEPHGIALASSLFGDKTSEDIFGDISKQDVFVPSVADAPHDAEELFASAPVLNDSTAIFSAGPNSSLGNVFEEIQDSGNLFSNESFTHDQTTAESSLDWMSSAQEPSNHSAAVPQSDHYAQGYAGDSTEPFHAPSNPNSLDYQGRPAPQTYNSNPYEPVAPSRTYGPQQHTYMPGSSAPSPEAPASQSQSSYSSSNAAAYSAYNPPAYPQQQPNASKFISPYSQPSSSYNAAPVPPSTSSYQLPAPTFAGISYDAFTNGTSTSPSYGVSSGYGALSAQPAPPAPAPKAVDIKQFRTSSFDAYDPPIPPKKASAFRSSGSYGRQGSSSPVPYGASPPTVLHGESRYLSPPPTIPPGPPPRSSAFNTTAPLRPPSVNRVPPTQVPPPPRSTRTPVLPPHPPPPRASTFTPPLPVRPPPPNGEPPSNHSSKRTENAYMRPSGYASRPVTPSYALSASSLPPPPPPPLPPPASHFALALPPPAPSLQSPFVPPQSVHSDSPIDEWSRSSGPPRSEEQPLLQEETGVQGVHDHHDPNDRYHRQIKQVPPQSNPWTDDDDDLGLGNARKSSPLRWDDEDKSNSDAGGGGSPVAPASSSSSLYVRPYPPAESIDVHDRSETSDADGGYDPESHAGDGFRPSQDDDFRSSQRVDELTNAERVTLVSDGATNYSTPDGDVHLIPHGSLSATPDNLYASTKVPDAYKPSPPLPRADYQPPSPPNRIISDSPAPVPSFYTSAPATTSIHAPPLSHLISDSPVAAGGIHPSSSISTYAPSILPPPHRRENGDVASYTPAFPPAPPASYEPPQRYSQTISTSLTTNASYEPHPVQTANYSPPSLFVVPSSLEHQQASATTRALYVPSPSQTAVDDPRSRARIPIFFFGFGGKVVTCFHQHLDATAGFDVSLTARRPSPLLIRSLTTVVPSSALEPSTAEFPGPLFSGASTTAASAMTMVRNTTPALSGAAKTKKAAVLKYLSERADELEKGLGFYSTSKDMSTNRRSAEGRAMLLRLLGVMVENDGKLSGTPVIEEQTRSAILPSGGPAFSSKPSPVSPNPTLGFATPTMDPVYNESTDTLLATYHLRGSHLDKLQSLLLTGRRREACHYALDQKLWAHAMLISSSIDKDLWKDVVNEFIRSELGVQMSAPALTSRPDLLNPSSGKVVSNGRESLRVVYGLFSGQGTAAVQEMLPPKNLLKAGETRLLALPPALQATPVSPNFPLPSLTAHIPDQILSKWSETAATILSNTNGGDNSQVLTALGDYLISNSWIEAAHVCYLLSPSSSPLNGIGAPSVRMVLVGSESPSTRRSFHVDSETIRFTEVVEFALSLASLAAKETFVGLPHLQPYKLLHAFQLAEVGQVKDAINYCDAISAVLKAHPRGSPYFTRTFLEQHQDLMARLAGQADKNSSWISRNLKKPSIDTIGSWSLNKLTKFIEGDDPSPIPEEEAVVNDKPTATVGPFSHYSAISSATTSRLPSPTGSTKNEPIPGVAPPRRTGSAMSARAYPTNPTAPIDRSVSAMGYLRPQKASPPTSYYSASPTTPNFNFYVNGASESSTGTDSNVLVSQQDAASLNGGGGGGWWSAAGLSSTTADTEATPTASSFQPESVDNESGNFISLMDTFAPGPSSAPMTSSTLPVRAATEEFEDDDDLGLGNSNNRKQGSDQPGATASIAEDQPPSKKTAKTPEPNKTEEARPAAKGWLSWWVKSDSKPPPIRANLGESKNTFYYDKELKKWVNGKEDSSATPAATPLPPPSRAQTASPSSMGGTGEPSAHPPPLNSSTPPPRAQSAMGMSKGPPKSATPPGSIRASSGLSVSFVPSTTTDGPPIPTVRARSAQGQRRNARSRYVDVFNQPPPTS